MEKKTRVGVFPDPYVKDKWHTEGNQNLRFWATAVEKYDYEVVGVPLEQMIDTDRLDKLNLDILHIHWPETILSNFLDHSGWWSTRPIIKHLHGWALLKVWLDRLGELAIPVVLQIHDIKSHQHGSQSLRGQLDMYLRRRLYEVSRAVMTQEHSSIACIEQMYGPKLFGVSPLGDFSLFHGDKIDKKVARKMLGLASEDRVFICLGTARPNRNPRRTIEVFNHLEEAQAKLFVAGINTHQYEKFSESANIRFFKGMLSSETVRDMFCAADFLINDAHQYLTSGILRCAMSYGLPVITHKYGAARDMVEGAAIYLDASGESLKRAVATAVSMKSDQYQNMQLAAEQRNQERKWEAAGAEFHRIYSKLLN